MYGWFGSPAIIASALEISRALCGSLRHPAILRREVLVHSLDHVRVRELELRAPKALVAYPTRFFWLDVFLPPPVGHRPMATAAAAKATGKPARGSEVAAAAVKKCRRQ